MRILNYKYSDGPAGGWDYSKVDLGNINLIVGETGSGKTRFLNTVFNIGSIIRNGRQATRGYWDIELSVNDTNYIWNYRNATGNSIDSEKLIRIKNGKEEVLVDRTNDEFLFKGTKLPKLSSQISAIQLLKEEEDIREIFVGFGKIARRSFFSDEMERAAAFSTIPSSLQQSVAKSKNSALLYEYPLSLRLYLLRENFKDKYDQICGYYKSIFTNVESFDFPNASKLNLPVEISESGKTPVFAIKEKNVPQLIGIHELSSGMQKVLLLLTDIMTLPGGWIYLLDEYENSLGINAINFLPEFLDQHGNGNQFIITTHHPYLINNMPIKNWYVFHRSGSRVDIKYGNELEARYGKSKQKAFIQLMNDPIYTGEQS